jgi:hypothetical protein
MSLSADDEFLNVIAHQARVAYATQQLSMCREALRAWQANTEGEVHDHPRVLDELAEYTRQIAHWQDYLGCLGAMSALPWGCEIPLF